MGLENETRLAGLKNNIYRTESSFLFLLQLYPPVAPVCVKVHALPRSWILRGVFRRLFHVEQRRIPLRYLLSGFRDKFCSRESLTQPLGFYVSPLFCLVPSSFVCEFTQYVVSRGSRYSWEKNAPVLWATSKSPWIVGNPPFVPQRTSIPSPLRCTWMLGVSLYDRWHGDT